MGETAEIAADQTLVDRAVAGDHEAFESLVLRYQDRVYGIALRLCRSAEEAEDVVQETFLKVHKGLAAFGGRSAFYTWLFKIAVNAAHSRLRSLGRLRTRERIVPVGNPTGETDDPPEAVEPVSAEKDPAEAAETADSAERVRRAVDELEAERREVVVLRDIEGLSYEEIAEVTGSSRAAVKSRLHRARVELVGALKDLAS